jgi:hypothetical protein
MDFQTRKSLGVQIARPTNMASLLFLDRFALKYSPQSPQYTPFLLGEGMVWLAGRREGGRRVQRTAIWVETKYFTNTLNFCF